MKSASPTAVTAKSRRPLAEYIGKRFSLPADKCAYSAVPENWGEFREMVVSSSEITPQQRADLLELIDAPAYGPSDYDAKERTLRTDPQMMSLNQMFRVARLYPEGSPEFNRVIGIALKYYPESPVANLNAAVAAIAAGDFDTAATLLEKGGDSPEAENARGVVATRNGDFDAARAHFEKALPLPAASKNLEELPR